MESVLQSPHVWRMGDINRQARQVRPTGHPALDGLLPDGGWPVQGLIDIHCDALGIGEMSLLLQAPALPGDDRGMAWLGPPALPYAPALLAGGLDPATVMVVQPENPADTLWAAEQILRSGVVATLFAWLRQPPDYAQLRRLHLAAETGQVAGFMFRSTAFMSQPSPAPLRLAFGAIQGQLQCSVFKARGLIARREVRLPALSALQQPQGPVPARLLCPDDALPGTPSIRAKPGLHVSTATPIRRDFRSPPCSGAPGFTLSSAGRPSVQV